MKQIAFFLVAWLISSPLFAATPQSGDQAFSLEAQVHDAQTVVLQWHIAPGYHLYKSRIQVTPSAQTKAQLGPLLLPKGAIKHNATLGRFAILSGNPKATLPVLTYQNPQLTLSVHYQGCSATGFCFPPQNKVISVNLNGPYNTWVKPLAIDIPTQQPIQSSPIDKLFSHNIFWIILSFAGFGLLIAATPCVLPMIPILSSIILGNTNKAHHHARSFFLSLAYVLGMALTYALVGIVFGLLGSNIQTALQTPWLIGLFAALFVVMALSLFGYFELQLPARLQSRLTQSSNHQKHGSLIGAFIMGMLSSLMLSPCVTPPLVGALGYISTTGNALIGGLALFSLGIGMGIPLLAIGLGSKKLLPKAGPWMTVIKKILGMIMLGMAILLLTRIFPPILTLLLWAALSLSVGIQLGAFQQPDTLLKQYSRLIGWLCCLYSILLIVGLWQGNTNPLRPIPFASIPTPAHFSVITSQKKLTDALQTARYQNQPVALDFYADWCISCQEMERFTFTNKHVKHALGYYRLLRIDVTQNNARDRAIQKHYHVIAPPTIIIFSGNGQERTRLVGMQTANQLLAALNGIPAGASSKNANKSL